MSSSRKSLDRSSVLVVVSAITLFAALGASQVSAQVVAWDMVGSTSQNLTSFVDDPAIPFTSAADGFQKFQRGVSSTIPFAVLDDSAGSFPPDSLGIIKTGNVDEFFGATDTVNGDTSGPVSATWVFDISSATGALGLSIDMGAMGDFETNDTFTWEYSIDGGPTLTAFSNTVDEAGSHTYTLEGGASFTLNDPMLVDGIILSNDLATFTTALSGTGSELTLTLTLQTDSGSEAMAFQNLVVTSSGTPPPPGVAFDMVASTDLNLTSFTNPWSGGFTSAADGFQKLQRGVSASIPFSIADDSLSIFPADSLGIIKEGNTDVFFGVTDTQNPDNSGPVSATWVFNVSGASGLGLSIDMGAMGDFESTDYFDWTYSVDGGPELTAFSSTVDEAVAHTYTLEGGGSFTLNDPMLVQGTILSNDLATFSTSLFGEGSALTVTLTAQTDGGSEAFAFQNLIVTEGNVPPAPFELEIYEIQGSGTSSFFNGAQVITDDNVVTALGTDGFFMQTPTARSDGDVDTSDGIFVFTGSFPAVSVGDLVDVTGEVDEFFGFTEIDPATITIDGGGVVPLPVAFDATVPSPDPAFPSCSIEFECYEGMLVEIVDGTVTGPNQRFSSDTVAEVFITAAPARTFREPGIEFPGMSGLPVWDGNPEVFELDPDKLGLPNQMIPAGSSFSATGVIGFDFGDYELWPSTLTVDSVATLPVPVRPTEPGELTVGTLNVFRLFAGDALSLSKLSAHIRDVLLSPDVLAVQEVGDLAVLQDLADQISADSAGAVSYTPYLEPGNDVGGINVGFLVGQHISVDAITQLGKGDLFNFDNPPSPLHDRPPLLLEGKCQLEYGTYPISVMVVHNRSLNGITTTRTQQKRFEQAESIAAMIDGLQATDPSVRLIVLGDFNAFEFADGYVDAVGIITGDYEPADSLVCAPPADCTQPDEPRLTNRVLDLEQRDRYSFIFEGNAQVLDHALTSNALTEDVSGVQFGRGNADAAVELINSYDTVEVNSQLVPVDPALRSSDHDGLVVFINKDEDADGVPNDFDFCPGTAIPEDVPTRRLLPFRYALVDDDTTFDTRTPRWFPHELPTFTTGDTAGCSCDQILDELPLWRGIKKVSERFGCPLWMMKYWTRIVDVE